MKQKIKINIADRIYTLTIEAAREEAMRKAVKNINEAISKYKSRMSNIDEVDALSMVILQYAMSLVEIEQKDEIGSVVNELSALNKQLEDYIQSSGR
ncbi:MAG: cell division protein ZapA [Bacteroidales bacterium]|nr:cell division protein ZapA [Bacteroidales bacterium]